MQQHKVFISILIFYLLLFLPFLGVVHLFDWDEINFAEAAREMLVTGDWWNVQIGYEPFWEKPPLFIWMQALSMSVFGVSEFAARLPNVIIGLVTLIVLYRAVYLRYTQKAAIYAVLLYIGSFTPHFYFKSGIIDPTFNLFIFLSILGILKYIETKKVIAFFWSGFWLGLAIITKGPAALLIVGVTGLVYQLYYKHHFYSFKSLFFLLGGLLVVPSFNFGIQIYQSGFWFLREFIIYQIDLFRYPIASHGQPWFYHAIVLLVGCFPLVIIALPAIFKRVSTPEDYTFTRLSKVLFWVVLIIFSSVTTKIVHYSSMCYLPLSVVGGVWLANKNVLTNWQKVLFTSVGIIWCIVFAAIGSFGVEEFGFKTWLVDTIKDDFVKAQLLTEANWSILPLFLAVVYIILIVYTLLKNDILSIISFLTLNATIITLFLVSIIQPLEKTLQGEWINHLKTYQGKEMAHFTLGFKSYAHIYYTKQQDFRGVNQIKNRYLAYAGKKSYYELNQFEKQEFDVLIRDYIIQETFIPISVSVKIDKFEQMNAYPELEQVFNGNGYGVWERKKNNQESTR
jgi:hypothetical protein